MSKPLALDPKETRELIALVLTSAKALGAALDDNKIDIKDALKLLPILRQIKPAFEGIAKIPEELKQLDQEQVKLLAQDFAKDFDLPNDQIEGLIEISLEIGLNLLVLILGLRK